MKSAGWTPLVVAVLLSTLLAAACNVPAEYSNAPRATPAEKDTSTRITGTVDRNAPQQPEPNNSAAPGDIESRFLEAGLTDVQSLDERILVKLQYSTTQNFAHVDLYGPLQKCYLRTEAAEKLARAQDILETKKPGWRLLCLDCARPRSVQQQMWDSLRIPNKANYLSHPGRGSMHNYGIAIDITLADEKGNPVDMGTPFDFFGEKAQPQREKALLASGELTQQQIDNRLLLRGVMREARWGNIQTEWWHFVAFSDSNATRRFRIIE